MDFSTLLAQFCDTAPASLRVYSTQLTRDFKLHNFSQLSKLLDLLLKVAPPGLYGQVEQLHRSFTSFLAQQSAAGLLNSLQLSRAPREPTIEAQIQQHSARQFERLISFRQVHQESSAAFGLPERQERQSAPQVQQITQDQLSKLCENQAAIHKEVEAMLRSDDESRLDGIRSQLIGIKALASGIEMELQLQMDGQPLDYGV